MAVSYRRHTPKARPHINQMNYRSHQRLYYLKACYRKHECRNKENKEKKNYKKIHTLNHIRISYMSPYSHRNDRMWMQFFKYAPG